MPGYLDDNRISARLAEVERKTSVYTVCRAIGSTDGAGGFLPGLFTEGCTLTVLVNAIRLTFNTPRPTTRYHVDAYHTTNQPRYAVDAAKSLTAVDIQFRNDNGTQVSSSGVVIDFNIKITDSD